MPITNLSPTELLELRAQLIDKQVTPARTEAWRGLTEAGLWGRLAIQFTFVLNGGALALLPALMSQTSGYPIDRAAAGWSAWLFTFGLIAGALCCFVAYVNFRVVTDSCYALANQQDNYINHVLYGSQESLELAKRASDRQARMYWWDVRLGPVGLVLGLAAFAMFAWGALRLIPGLPWPRLCW
jgi:hypothetical protein